MRAINHSLTGAVIGLTIAEPLLAVPLAIMSHFVMDAIPHYGDLPGKLSLKGHKFTYLLIADAILCALLVLTLTIIRPIRWPMAIICAFLAAAPDLLSVNRFYKSIKELPWKPNLYSRFAHKIQWFERPSGAIIEVVWLVSIVICLTIFLKP